MSKQRSEKIKLTIFISFAVVMILVCAAISVNIVKEMDFDNDGKKDVLLNINDSLF